MQTNVPLGSACRWQSCLIYLLLFIFCSIPNMASVPKAAVYTSVSLLPLTTVTLPDAAEERMGGKTGYFVVEELKYILTISV